MNIRPFDPESLTLQDVQELIEHFDKNSLNEVFAELGEDLTSEGIKVIAYLLWLNERKHDPSWTLEKSYQLPLRVFNAVMEDLAGGTADPPSTSDRSGSSEPPSAIKPPSA